MTTEMVAAIFAGLVIIIPLIGGILVKLFEIAHAAKVTKELSEVAVRDGKAVLLLVNGPYGAALQENAELRAWKAARTANATDAALAQNAQTVADEHKVRGAEAAAAVASGAEILEAKKGNVP